MDAATEWNVCAGGEPEDVPAGRSHDKKSAATGCGFGGRARTGEQGDDLLECCRLRRCASHPRRRIGGRGDGRGLLCSGAGAFCSAVVVQCGIQRGYRDRGTVVGRPGLEPGACGLKVRRAANCASGPKKKIVSAARRDV